MVCFFLIFGEIFQIAVFIWQISMLQVKRKKCMTLSELYLISFLTVSLYFPENFTNIAVSHVDKPNTSLGSLSPVRSEIPYSFFDLCFYHISLSPCTVHLRSHLIISFTEETLLRSKEVYQNIFSLSFNPLNKLGMLSQWVKKRHLLPSLMTWVRSLGPTW